jgi:Complex I intermediate-associated protein 30 (CIA30)
MTLEVWPANASLYWRLVTDTVMGGVSRGAITRVELGGRKAIRMCGNVSIDNNGGFIQLALDLAPETGSFDAGGFTGLEIDVLGNQEKYSVHLRTAEIVRPQQSYRHSFLAAQDWRTLQLPFVQFRPHRTDIPINTTRLTRIGLVAIGRAFTAKLAIARLAFF